MENCVFCKIAKGEIPSHKIYEDDTIFVFLDIHPIQPGHLLIIPKVHEPDFYKLDDTTYNHLMAVGKKFAQIISDSFHPKKVGLMIAGWDVDHTHVHIVPMHEYHDITSKKLLEGGIANPSSQELEIVAEKIRKIMK